MPVIDEMNYYGMNRIPFLFIVDFEIKNPVVIPLVNVNSTEILYSIGEMRNYQIDEPAAVGDPVLLSKYPLSFEQYKEKFNFVVTRQINGDSYILNLTFPTKIDINIPLKDVFLRSRAKYKLLYKNEFVVFSPEAFIKIRGNIVSSYPMKGTIDAAVPDAANAILADEKEFSEHLTITDLIRNDLNMISTGVKVEKFRYVEKIRTSDKELYQISSKITGILDADFNKKIGTIIASLLPAGSISGAPKKKTLEIIKQAEGYDRGYYTGVFGYFGGDSLDSGVMIRYIENNNGSLYYKSGGGITVYSDPKLEYQELIDKVYVPIV